MAEKVILGDTYKVEPVIATRAITLQARLFKAAGPLAAQLPSVLSVAAGNATDEQKASANGALIKAISDVFASLPPDEFAHLVKDIVEIAKIKRNSGVYDPIDFDGDMTPRMGSIIPVVAFVLREVFGDFFSGLRALGDLKAMAA